MYISVICRYGYTHDLQEYEGGRSFEELQAFAATLTPGCGPGEHLELCDEAQKADIAKYEAFSDAKLEAKVRKLEAEITAAESEFDVAVEALQGTYDDLQQQHEDKSQAVQDSGFKLMKQILASK